MQKKGYLWIVECRGTEPGEKWVEHTDFKTRKEAREFLPKHKEDFPGFKTRIRFVRFVPVVEDKG